MPTLNSSNFSNKSRGNKKKVNPIFPFLLMLVLAVSLILLSSFVADVNSAMYQQQQELQSIYDEQNAAQ